MIERFELELEDAGRNLKQLDIDEIREFTEEALSGYGTAEKYEEANRVTDVMLKLLQKKKFINPVMKKQAWLNALIAGSLLHNLFYSGTISSLFAARDALYLTAKVKGIPPDTFHAVCSVIESQLGEDNPIAGCRAVPNTPGEAFVTACWIVSEQDKGKEMPITIW